MAKKNWETLKKHANERYIGGLLLHGHGYHNIATEAFHISIELTFKAILLKKYRKKVYGHDLRILLSNNGLGKLLQKDKNAYDGYMEIRCRKMKRLKEKSDLWGADRRYEYFFNQKHSLLYQKSARAILKWSNTHL